MSDRRTPPEFAGWRLGEAAGDVAELPVLADGDVVVVGGGAAGVAAATVAAEGGLSVVLIERYGFCGGAAVAGMSGTQRRPGRLRRRVGRGHDLRAVGDRGHRAGPVGRCRPAPFEDLGLPHDATLFEDFYEVRAAMHAAGSDL
ncbi:FAD-dependent oxidoreductase [Pseudonocardia hierapolitana]|uniref:FAD-dependent oxidoreductase n=1 Tax=Pseudonocardia hierapolitana TaxID=1128676 RepID=UPI001BAE8124|nr:FAD-dependent oxidoreductase [Pseudonocardia hierapolitana]